MPRVTLIKPKRLNAEGRMWEQGVPVTVSADVARRMAGNPRFLVEGIGGAGQEIPTSRPSNKRILKNQILDAVASLDSNDSHAWAENGLPNRYALSFALGWEVTTADMALVSVGDDEDEDTPDTQPEPEVEAEPEAKKGVVIKRGAKAKAEAEKEPAAPAEEPSVTV